MKIFFITPLTIDTCSEAGGENLAYPAEATIHQIFQSVKELRIGYSTAGDRMVQ